MFVYCPKCEADMEVSIYVEPEDQSVGIFGTSYEVTVEDAECDCELTEKDLDSIVEGLLEAKGEQQAERYLESLDYDY
jgi:hypothetical protein